MRRKWLTSDEFWRGIEKLSFYVLFPTVLFEHSSKVDLNSTEFFRLIIALIVANLIIAFGLVFYQTRRKFDNIQFTSIFQGATRYNNYTFFALGAALFGDKGLNIISTISPYLLIVTNITAVMSFVYYIPKEEGNISTKNSIILMVKSIAMNPFVIANIIGLLFNYLDIKLNLGIEKTIHSLADSALPIGILIVGAGIKFNIKQEYFNQILFTSAIKLIAMPIVTFIILWMTSVTGMAKSVGILFSCLPCASSSYILSRQLGGDPDTMSSTITFTTIFSIISLSILVYLLG